MSRNASAVPGSRDSASAHASAGSNPGKPSPTGDPTRPVPSRGTIVRHRAPKSSSSPTTNRWIVPSSFFAMKSMSRSRKTPRPCSRSTSTRTRPSKSAPGPKLTAITCNGPAICRPPLSDCRGIVMALAPLGSKCAGGTGSAGGVSPGQVGAIIGSSVSSWEKIRRRGQRSIRVSPNGRPDFSGLHGRSAVQPRPSPAANGDSSGPHGYATVPERRTSSTRAASRS